MPERDPTEGYCPNGPRLDRGLGGRRLVHNEIARSLRCRIAGRGVNRRTFATQLVGIVSIPPSWIAVGHAVVELERRLGVDQLVRVEPDRGEASGERQRIQRAR